VGPAARADEKKLFIRQVEVFAAYAAYTDHEIGRVIQAVEDMGKLDNTLIIYINGDNGTSAEGGPLGTPNEVALFNGVDACPVDVQMKFYDVWGTEQTYNAHVGAGWSWAFDTPFNWFKQIASHLGGIRQGMAVSWPGAHQGQGRHPASSSHHVIDVVPTILEAAGIQQPRVRWTASSRSRSRAPASPTPSTRRTPRRRRATRPSTSRCSANGALYHDGWMLTHQGRSVRRGRPSAPPTRTRSTTRHLGALQPRQRLHRSPTTSPRRIPQKVEGDAGGLHRGGEEVPGAAARCLGRRRASWRRGRTSPRAATRSSTRGR
jgi:arylsulfatase